MLSDRVVRLPKGRTGVLSGEYIADMRNFAQYLLAILTFTLAVSAQEAPRLLVEGELPLTPGQVVTVRVENAPAATKFASFDLSPEIHGLMLYPKGEGVWEGSLALLPSMEGQTFQPRAELFAADRSAVVLNAVTGWEVASSSSQPAGLLLRTNSGRAAVAFDQTIRLDTLELRIDGRQTPVVATPRNNLLVLPSSVDLAEVDSVSALNLDGQRVVISGPVQASRSQLLTSVDISSR